MGEVYLLGGKLVFCIFIIFYYSKAPPYHFFLGEGVSVPGLEAFRCPLDGGASRGGAREARPPYFYTKRGPEGPKKSCFGDRPPSDYLRVWMTGPPLSQGLDHC